jgi:Carboxypeptidase regulatory-like domain
VFAILYAFSVLPDDALAGTLANGSQRFPLETRVGQARTDGKADFWTSIGGQYKASVDYVVTLSCEPGTSFERGPEVRTQTLRLHDVDSRRANLVETNRAGGTVRDAEGGPVVNAWVILADQGVWAVSDAEGRFRFDRLPDGTYDCVARAPDGREASGALTVPGTGIDLTIGGAKPKAKAAPKRRR